VLPGAKEYMKTVGIDAHLDARYDLSIEEFDTLARMRSAHAEKPTFTTNLEYPNGWFDKYYKNKKRLIFRGAEDFIRKYEWS